MNGLLPRLQYLRRIGIRKIRTLLQGPPRHPEFVRAAHYFSDGWALNMWQVMDPRKVVAELRAIQRDGFNTIILVIPWRGFQQDQLEPVYDRFYDRQLNRVMSAADRLGLSVIVRVAYTYQIAMENNLSGIVQAQRLLLDEDTQLAWLDYLRHIYKICHSYRCFRLGFLSWEEYWHAFANWQLRRRSPRIALAESSGYLDYLRVNGMEAATEIPQPDDPGHKSFIAFANHRIREMYELALTAFPGLSAEFRVDKERIQDGDTVEWVRNDDYADLPGLRFSYWAPFMGAENEGEQLDAVRATHLFEHMLDEVSHQGSRPEHIVDQFNFVDEAPKFKGVHAEISQDQVADFLQLAAPLLLQKSSGYGVWAYRDYRLNVLFNARFLMGMRGWRRVRGRCRPLRRGGIKLGTGAILRQYLPPMVAGLQRGVSFERFILRVELHHLPATARLQVRVNAEPWLQLDIIEDEKLLSAKIPVDFGSVEADGLILELKNNGATLNIDSLSLYHYVFRGGLRLEDGTPSLHHRALLAFNETLERNQATGATGQTA